MTAMSGRLIPAVALAASLSACASAPDPADPSTGPNQTGPLYVTLLGDYSGHEGRIEVDGRVLVEGLLNLPPYGAEDRYLVADGTARTVTARVTLAACPASWTGEVRLEPMRSAYLMFEGCSVRALAPD